MKFSLPFLAIGAVLGSAACAVPQTPARRGLPRPVSAVTVIAKADTVVIGGERAFAAAELVYITAADGVGGLVDAGVIHGATAISVRTLNRRARDLLIKGKATSDAAEKARDAAALFDLADKLGALTERK